MSWSGWKLLSALCWAVTVVDGLEGGSALTSLTFVASDSFCCFAFFVAVHLVVLRFYDAPSQALLRFSCWFGCTDAFRGLGHSWMLWRGEIWILPVARNLIFISIDFEMPSSSMMSVSHGNRWLLFNRTDLGQGFLSASKISRGENKQNKTDKMQILHVDLWILPGTAVSGWLRSELSPVQGDLVLKNWVAVGS